MTGPGITVIVPNYNDSKYLPRCLRSVLEQQDGPQELVVIDDRSTDDSVALIRGLIAGDPRARLELNPVNLGANRTVCEALERVRTDYALFLAANDFLLPGMFARARRELARNPGAGLWSAMALLVDEEDRPIRLHPSAVVSMHDVYLPPERCARLAYRLGYWFTGTTAIYHCDTLRDVGGFDPVYGAPADLFAALAVSGRRGAIFSPEPLAAIRIHEGSYSSRALSDVAGIERMIRELETRAPRIAPAMFTPGMVQRTALRYRFACVRSAGGALLQEIAGRSTGWRRIALRLLDGLIPAAMSWLRVAISFFILRPFDALPLLWYRGFGWLLVRWRTGFIGRLID